MLNEGDVIQMSVVQYFKNLTMNKFEKFVN